VLCWNSFSEYARITCARGRRPIRAYQRDMVLFGSKGLDCRIERGRRAPYIHEKRQTKVQSWLNRGDESDDADPAVWSTSVKLNSQPFLRRYGEAGHARFEKYRRYAFFLVCRLINGMKFPCSIYPRKVGGIQWRRVGKWISLCLPWGYKGCAFRFIEVLILDFPSLVSIFHLWSSMVGDWRVI
jgi:hypothetical protein